MTLENILDLSYQHSVNQTSKVRLKSGKIRVTTSYIAIHTYSIKYVEQGAKVVVVIEKNYFPREQNTYYFNKSGQIVSRKEFYNSCKK